MKQVLVSMRPTDGDTVGCLDRARSGAGTSSSGPKLTRHIRRSSEDEWVEKGRATVFVSI